MSKTNRCAPFWLISIPTKGPIYHISAQFHIQYLYNPDEYLILLDIFNKNSH